jgi:hypothetical protein
MSKYLWDAGVFLLGTGITFMATEMWPWAYWPGVVAIYAGIAALGYHIGTEESFQSMPLGTQIAVGIMFLSAIYIWSANVVFAAAPLLFPATANKGDKYPVGFDLAGIKWQKSYSDVRIDLRNPTSHDYKNVDLSIYTDLQIAQVGQITDIPNVSYFPQSTLEAQVNLEGKDKRGHKTSIPVVPQKGMAQSNQIYRVLIDKLPKKSTVKLVLAVVRINPMVNGKMPQTLFSADSVPAWIAVKGDYMAIGRERHVRVTHNF